MQSENDSWRTTEEQDRFLEDFPHHNGYKITKDIADHVVHSITTHPDNWYTGRYLFGRDGKPDKSRDECKLSYIAGPRAPMGSWAAAINYVWIHSLEKRPWALNVSCGGREYGGVTFFSVTPMVWLNRNRVRIMRAVSKAITEEHVLMEMKFYDN